MRPLDTFLASVRLRCVASTLARLVDDCPDLFSCSVWDGGGNARWDNGQGDFHVLAWSTSACVAVIYDHHVGVEPEPPPTVPTPLKDLLQDATALADDRVSQVFWIDSTSTSHPRPAHDPRVRDLLEYLGTSVQGPNSWRSDAESVSVLQHVAAQRLGDTYILSAQDLEEISLNYGDLAANPEIVEALASLLVVLPDGLDLG